MLNKRTNALAGRVGRGFTLMELLITVVILVLLMGAMAFNFDVMGRTAALEEGASRVQSAMRLARAEAARRGRRVRLELAHAPETFKPGGAMEDDPREILARLPKVAMQMTCELEPLTEPGVFSRITPLSGWAGEGFSELAMIKKVVRLDDAGQVLAVRTHEVQETGGSTGADSSARGEPISGGAEAGVGRSAILFYPDGASESVRVILAGAESRDARLAAVELDGWSGQVSIRYVTLDLDNPTEAAEEVSAGAVDQGAVNDMRVPEGQDPRK